MIKSKKLIFICRFFDPVIIEFIIIYMRVLQDFFSIAKKNDRGQEIDTRLWVFLNLWNS